MKKQEIEKLDNNALLITYLDSVDCCHSLKTAKALQEEILRRMASYKPKPKSKKNI